MYPSSVWLSGRRTSLAARLANEVTCQNSDVEAECWRVRTIHAVFQNDGQWFIARCLDVPVTTQGRTLAAAKKNLQEAVELYLETWGEPAVSRPGVSPI